MSKEYKRMMAMLQDAINRAQQQSPYEQALMQDWQNTRNWLDKKDYRNLPAGVNVDMLPLADYKRFASYSRPRADQAAAGSGYNMALQNQAQLSDNLLTRGWGQNYENAVGDLRRGNDVRLGALQDAYSNRMNIGVSGQQALLQAKANQPKGFWSTFLPSLIQGGAQVGSAMIGAGRI